jgi:hypothetical protein
MEFGWGAQANSAITYVQFRATLATLSVLFLLMCLM